MSKWITDRIPTAEHTYVFNAQGRITLYHHINKIGQPWMPITPPEPYVEAKRFTVTVVQGYQVYYSVWENDYDGGVLATRIPTREAAERIAAIYEEVMP